MNIFSFLGKKLRKNTFSTVWMNHLLHFSQNSAAFENIALKNSYNWSTLLSVCFYSPNKHNWDWKYKWSGYCKLLSALAKTKFNSNTILGLHNVLIFLKTIDFTSLLLLILPYKIEKRALFPFHCSYLTRVQKLNKISRCQGHLKELWIPVLGLLLTSVKFKICSNPTITILMLPSLRNIAVLCSMNLYLI